MNVFDYLELKETYPFIVFKNIDPKHLMVYETRKYIIEYIEYCEKIHSLIAKINSKIIEMNDILYTKLNLHLQIIKTDYKKRILYNLCVKNQNSHKQYRKMIQIYLRISTEILIKANNSKRDKRELVEKFEKKEERNFLLIKSKVINNEGNSLDNIDLFLKFTSSKDLYRDKNEWKQLFAKKIVENKLNLSEENMNNDYFSTKSKLMINTEVQELFEIFKSEVVNIVKEEESQKKKEEELIEKRDEIVLKKNDIIIIKDYKNNELYISRKEQEITDIIS